MYLCAGWRRDDRSGQWKLRVEGRRCDCDSLRRKTCNAKNGDRAAGPFAFFPGRLYYAGNRGTRFIAERRQQAMSVDVLCLRPRIDFERANALPAAEFTVAYRAPNDAEVISLMKQARALVIPAVGPKLNPEIFANTTVKLVQVTGTGLDRLELPLHI